MADGAEPLGRDRDHHEDGAGLDHALDGVPEKGIGLFEPQRLLDDEGADDGLLDDAVHDQEAVDNGEAAIEVKLKMARSRCTLR